MTLFRKKTNNYPTIFPYSDKYSVSALSEQDLHISYSHRIVAKTSNRKPNLGETILIVAKKKNGVFIFAAIINGAIEDDRVNTWYDRGGNRWDNNYSIKPVSQSSWLSNEEIIKISGCADNEARIIWVDQMTGPKWGGFRQKILDHLLDE